MQIKPKTSLQKFLFRPGTKVLVCTSLLGFALNRFINDLQSTVISSAVIKSIKPIYTPNQIDLIIENSSLSKPPENLPTRTSIFVTFLQLFFNLLFIYLIFCLFEKFEK